MQSGSLTTRAANSTQGLRPSTNCPESAKPFPTRRSFLTAASTCGTDILRALALGADFVMMGRAWHYAVGALGEKGPPHLMHILRDDIELVMGNLGTRTLWDLKGALIRPDWA